MEWRHTVFAPLLIHTIYVSEFSLVIEPHWHCFQPKTTWGPAWMPLENCALRSPWLSLGAERAMWEWVSVCCVPLRGRLGSRSRSWPSRDHPSRMIYYGHLKAIHPELFLSTFWDNASLVSEDCRIDFSHPSLQWLSASLVLFIIKHSPMRTVRCAQVFLVRHHVRVRHLARARALCPHSSWCWNIWCLAT